MPFLKLKKFSKIERRRFPRIKEKVPILWRLKDGTLRGLGRLRDISASGMKFSAKEPIPEQATLQIEPQIRGGQASDLVLPLPWSKVIWVKKWRLGRGYQVGAEFIDINELDRAKLVQAIKSKLRVLADWETVKAKIVYIFLWAIIILGSFSFIQQYRSLIQTRNYLESALARSQKEVLKFKSAFFEERNKRLAQEGMFTQIIKERDGLLIDLQQARTNLSQTKSLLSQINVEKENLSKQMALLKERMHSLEGEVANLTEAKLALESRLNNLKELKLAIKKVKRDIFLAKVKALKKLDQIKLAKGNRGHIIKNFKQLPPVSLGTIVIKATLLEGD